MFRPIVIDFYYYLFYYYFYKNIFILISFQPKDNLYSKEPMPAIRPSILSTGENAHEHPLREGNFVYPDMVLHFNLICYCEMLLFFYFYTNNQYHLPIVL